ncbi:NADP-specific glutamate dehydrogenase [Thalassotalea sp. PS06]|uniref:NADP-specific glutamate dehydrogenase n=1 Tax=Thalassotalea sp. PS06 TaxID=2594005 RepID=UPI0011621074|nr:NADP-specific glutamate dehydrogenase [Thalassotalea sp. PS06]QDP01555.1 NADP-specific glutamate dehydrogenase [Thalassotalea sp. PS06]
MKSAYTKTITERLSDLYQEQKEYLQAIDELVVYSELDSALRESFEAENVLERLLVPDRVISFNVTWVDDSDKVHVNQGWRVQHSNLIGPYKGGLRFHPSVNESVLKFLALEQTFKNALTGLPIGGAKGGSNFDPKGRSQREVMRFCQAFMDELFRHIGPNTDVPAGDINVGTREIGYLFGRFRRLQNQFTGAITGKDVDFGGSHARIESTGFGVIFFAQRALETHQSNLENKTICISGAGNVALHAAQKAIDNKAIVISLSNSKGCLFAQQGLSASEVDALIKDQNTVNLEEYAEKIGAKWLDGDKPWELECEIAIPCATQNELSESDAKQLISNGVRWVFEGANMPCEAKAITRFRENNVMFAPAKAVNAGGVAVSLFEMGQNASFNPETFKAMEERLRQTMYDIHDNCMSVKSDDYLIGANSFALKKLVQATLQQGI